MANVKKFRWDVFNLLIPIMDTQIQSFIAQCIYTICVSFENVNIYTHCTYIVRGLPLSSVCVHSSLKCMANTAQVMHLVVVRDGETFSLYQMCVCFCFLVFTLDNFQVHQSPIFDIAMDGCQIYVIF